MSAGNLFVTVSEDNLEFYRRPSPLHKTACKVKVVLSTNTTHGETYVWLKEKYIHLLIVVFLHCSTMLWEPFSVNSRKLSVTTSKVIPWVPCTLNMNRHLQKIDPQLNLYGPEFRQLFDTANGLIKVLATTEPRGKKQAPDITDDRRTREGIVGYSYYGLEFT